MAETITNHRHILIDNFEDGEKIHYPLIVIKGTIYQYLPEECSNLEEKTQSKLMVVLKHFNYEVSTSHGQFKFILYLREGENKIEIKYCCDKMDLNIEFIPRKTSYTVCPLYIVCKGHDGMFQAPETEEHTQENACMRINLITRLLQCVVAEKLFEKSYPRKTFSLENTCQIFHSELLHSKIKTMSQKEIWEYLAREIMNSNLGSTKKKYLGFLSCTRYHGEKYQDWMKSHQDLMSITEGFVALGGGGLALFGTASLYTWPSRFEDIVSRFEDQTLVDKRKFLDDSCYRGTLGGCFSTSVGSVLHELCHTFDLGHTNFGIMSRGFDNIEKVFVPNMCQKNIIVTKFRSSIEFRESLGPSHSSEKLHTPKQCRIKHGSRAETDADDTFFTKSCATILNHHRWFNNFPEVSKQILKFDTIYNSFVSTAGLRVVEIRRGSDELVIANWVFDGKILKYSFYMPMNMENFNENSTCVVFAEDNIGNLLKFNYCHSSKT